MFSKINVTKYPSGGGWYVLCRKRDRVASELRRGRPCSFGAFPRCQLADGIVNVQEEMVAHLEQKPLCSDHLLASPRMQFRRRWAGMHF